MWVSHCDYLSGKKYASKVLVRVFLHLNGAEWRGWRNGAERGGMTYSGGGGWLWLGVAWCGVQWENEKNTET